MNIYLAARYGRLNELNGYKRDLEARGHVVPARWLPARGHVVPARWLLGEHQVHGVEAARSVERDGPVPADQAVLFATDDVEDVLAADVLVAFTEPPRSSTSRGGRHVEFGMALGWRAAGMTRPLLVVVGPLENVFHAHPLVDGRYDTWNDFLDDFEEWDEIWGPKELAQ